MFSIWMHLIAPREVKDIAKKCGAGALPEAHGGEKRPPTADWVAERLANFPRMGLPAYDVIWV